MPPIIPPRAERYFQQTGRVASHVRGIQSQQDDCIATSDGQVTFRTGQLQQYPSGSAPNYTTGYGWEILQAGLGTAPVQRGGELTWVSPAGGTQTINGTAYFDSGGLLRVVLGQVGASRGWIVFDTNGNQVGEIPYFSGGAYAGVINFYGAGTNGGAVLRDPAERARGP